MRAALAALLLVGCVGVAAQPHPSLPAIGSLDGLGVNIHFTDAQPGELEMIRAAGFRWVRMDFTWAATERKPGAYDFAAYDRLVAALEKHGLRAVFILDYGNPHYAAPGEGHPHTSRAGTEEFRAAFAKWAAVAVARYAGKGFLWEIWNEPNHAGFWKPKPDVQQYIALAQAAGAAIRAAAPKEAIIGPATSTIDLPFLEACMQAGLLEIFDAVSVHPYRQKAPETVEKEYRSVRLLIRKYAPKDKAIPILSGEWGYSTAYPAFAKMNDAERETAQAKYVARMFLTNLANDVPLSIWYDWRDDGDNPQEAEHRFGLVRRKYRAGEKEVFEPKPAYRAVQTLTQQLAGMQFSKRLLPDPAQQNVVMDLFAQGAEIHAAVWTSDQTRADTPRPESAASLPQVERQILLPFSAGEVESVGCLGKKLTERVGDQGLRFRPRDAVEYLSPHRPDSLLRLAAAWERAPLDVECSPPKQERLSLSLTNTFGASLRVNGVKNPIEPGDSVPTGSDATPHSRLPTDYLTEYDPIRHPRHAYIDLAEPKWLFVQRFIAIVRNPVSARVFPPGADFVLVEMNNPSGQAWQARARYWFPGVPEVGSEPANVPAGDIALVEGETSKLVRLPSHPLVRRAGTRLQLWEGDNAGDFRSYGIPVSEGLLSMLRVQAHANGDPKVAHSASFDEAQPKEGPSLSDSSSFRLRYSFSAGWKFVEMVAEQKTINPRMTASENPEFWPDTFALWLHGDGKGCQPRIRFRDKTGQTFQSDGPKIDFTGWRYAKFPMQSTPDAPLAHWGGANDGTIHYPIVWDAIFLLDNVSREPVEGEVYLSAPTLIY